MEYRFPYKQIYAKNAGTYILTVTDSLSCSNSDTVKINAFPLPDVTVIGDSSLCIGSSVTLKVTGAKSYSWNFGLGNTDSVKVKPVKTSTYIVTCIGDNSCSKIVSETVNVYPLPVVSISGRTSVCSGSSDILTAKGALKYFWNNGIGQGNIFTVYPVTTTTYTVIGFDANNCTDTSQITVIAKPLPVTPHIAKHGDTLISDADNGNLWYRNDTLIKGQTGQKYIPAKAGYYYVIVYLNGCSSDSSNNWHIATGIEEITDNIKFLCFPNPVHTDLSVDLFPNYTDGIIAIYDVDGTEKIKQIIKSNKTLINCTDLRSGVYILKFVNDKYIIVRKIIKV